MSTQNTMSLPEIYSRRNVSLSDIHQENLNFLESERIKSVKERAATFSSGYEAVGVIFKRQSPLYCYVSHLNGCTEIDAYGYTIDLIRLKTFKKIEKGYRHYHAPILVTGLESFGSRVLIRIYWEGMPA
ncbi:hypothetical protein EH228_04520 [Erwinia endophytica]|uniref:hypothetical protein n=1 Tax=Erwinia endophytica TaxID=1563158 RepID=UPI0012660091|nr:hypothetical protein [Erwinia endophytica]KAB8312946.1 hypothetical protein EH228_04520 [Erwinia endophytica]